MLEQIVVPLDGSKTAEMVLPYITEIASLGTEAILSNPSIEPAVNTHDGKLHNLVRLKAQEE